MKKLFLLNIFMLIALSYCDCFGMSYGVITGETVTEFYTEYYDEGWASQTLSYTNGGLVFTYPTNLFTDAPTVVVSIELLSSYDSSTFYVAQVIDNSSTSATVYVSTGTLSTLEEAATGSVNVHLWAVGPTND
jgi:hypothetical protein